MTLYLIVIGLLACFMVFIPFFKGPHGKLQASTNIHSLEEASIVQQNVLKRYISDENDFHDKIITKFEWAKRRHYLSNRYLDISRRIDHLKQTAEK